MICVLSGSRFFCRWRYSLCLVWLPVPLTLKMVRVLSGFHVLLMCGTLKEMSNRKTGGDKQHERKRSPVFFGRYPRSSLHSFVPPPPSVPVPNKQPRFCGRKAIWSRFLYHVLKSAGQTHSIPRVYMLKSVLLFPSRIVTQVW